jgi:hypothetical protein
VEGLSIRQIKAHPKAVYQSKVRLAAMKCVGME